MLHDPAALRAAVAVLCLTQMLALLLAAAVSDLRWRQIPHTVCMAMAILVLPYGLASGWVPVAGFALHLLSALLLGAVLFGAFCFRLLGGGEVKMMAALGLWLTPPAALDALVITMIAGGLLRLFIARRHRHRLSRPSVPYGVAIAFAGATQLIGPLGRLLH